MKLYIAEKPAVALDIANALTDGKHTKRTATLSAVKTK